MLNSFLSAIDAHPYGASLVGFLIIVVVWRICDAYENSFEDDGEE